MIYDICLCLSHSFFRLRDLLYGYSSHGVQNVEENGTGERFQLDK